jgi:hypothetical protein
MTPMPSDAELSAAPAVQAEPIPAPQAEPVAAPVPAPVAAPVPQAAAGKPLAIEGLLRQSGLQGVDFKTVSAGPGENVRQWSTGDINGMYEQTPANGDFGYAVQSYLDRYREDCQGQLQVKMGPQRNTATGTVAQADIACPIESNTYSTSFVFVQGGGTFNAILHTGYPQDAAQVKSISDNVAASLGASGGLASQKPARGDAANDRAASLQVTVPAETPRRRFNIQPETPAAAAGSDEFETVIVQ